MMTDNGGAISVAQKGDYTLKIFQSEDVWDPRENMDNWGTMMCWHNRYRLGDRHNDPNPEDFLRGLLFSSFCASPEIIYNFIKAGGSKYACIKYNASTRETELYEKGRFREIFVVSYPAKLNKQGAVPDWFLDSCLELLSMKEMLALTELADGLVILPLYLYDHSGITMNTTGFSCPWDSGMIGWIYVEKEDIQKNFMKQRLTPEILEQAKRCLIAEVKYYDHYISGEIYEYILEKDGEEVDCCYDLICGYNELAALIEEYVPEECEGITKNLETLVFV